MFLALLPIVCLPLFLLLVVLICKNAGRPYTAIIFLGLQMAVFAVDISFWSSGLRFVTAMLAAAIAMAAEIYFRKLPRAHYTSSGLAFALTITWYFVVIGIVSAASV